jgi:hypothetical protein
MRKKRSNNYIPKEHNERMEHIQKDSESLRTRQLKVHLVTFVSLRPKNRRYINLESLVTSQNTQSDFGLGLRK